MRKLLAFLIFVLLSNFIFAQKEGNIWIFGDSVGLDFNYTPPTICHAASYSNEACSSICDKNGNLILYAGAKFPSMSNVICIWNKNHQIIHNGDTLKGNYSITQGILLLPIPKKEKQYLLLHMTTLGRLYYSAIDMNCNGNSGCVIKKNVQIFSNKLFSEKMNAVRHANGNDWWILSHSMKGDTIYKMLLTSDTILMTDEQKIGSIYQSDLNGTDAVGQMMFSRDGSKLASVFRKADVFDFDRCSGELSNWLCIDNLPLRNYGVSFSNNNRFLYVSHENDYPSQIKNLFQYDLTAINILNTKITVFQTNGDSIGIWQHSYGPDGRIYLSIANGWYPHNIDGVENKLYISTITEPDNLGINCNFVRKAIYLGGNTISLGLPNIPNYSLGALEGSPCDTIPEPVTVNNNVYIPNIFSPNNDTQNDKLFVRGQQIESLHFLIYNRWGNLVFESNDINYGWDGMQAGKPCETGVYVYRVEVVFKNGQTVEKRGNVTLVR